MVMDTSLVAAFISLFFLVIDPLAANVNRRIYERDKGKEGNEKRFNVAMKRRSSYKLACLFFLILAALLAIYSTKEESFMVEKELGELTSSIKELNETVEASDKRVARIEKYLWGSGSSGTDVPDEPVNPSGGPTFDYRTINERFSKVEEQLSDLSQRAATKEEVEIIREHIIELKKEVDEYNKVMERIAGIAGIAAK
jgi:hypothetical protein